MTINTSATAPAVRSRSLLWIALVLTAIGAQQLVADRTGSTPGGMRWVAILALTALAISRAGQRVSTRVAGIAVIAALIFVAVSALI